MRSTGTVGGCRSVLPLDFAAEVKARSMFLLSLILIVGALVMALRRRGQLDEAFRARRGDDQAGSQAAAALLLQGSVRVGGRGGWAAAGESQ